MNMKEVRDRARKIEGFTCRVCRECDGIACRGELPGVGGKGTGMSFIRNYRDLQNLELNMTLTYEEQEVSTETNLLGIDLAFPAMAAPIGGLVACFGDSLTDYEYSYHVVKGAKEAGVIGFTGDGVKLDFFLDPLQAIKDVDDYGIPTIKPWPMDEIKPRLDEVQQMKVPAVAMDIDAAGLPFISDAGKKLVPKSVDELREVVDKLDVPFIVKGVMTPESAKIAVEAGASAIVVSNHGGRVLDLTPSTISVLPEIVQAVDNKAKIIIDGGIRTGSHILGALALGADAVLIGRPVAVAAYGGGVEGVKLYFDTLKADFRNAMIMTGCHSIEDIDERVLR